MFDDLSYLPIGLGRSYGDVGLNENGTTISMTNHNEIISLDEKNGILNCESGLSIKDILSLIVPKGWFLPVVPGTRNVTIGELLQTTFMEKIIIKLEHLGIT